MSHTFCMLCPSGTFAISAGSLFCTPCPDGATAPVGSSSCTYISPVFPMQSLGGSVPTIPPHEVADAQIRDWRPRDLKSLCPSGSFFIHNAPMPKVHAFNTARDLPHSCSADTVSSVRSVLGQSHVNCRFSFLYPLPFGLSIITRRCRFSILCSRQTFAYFTAGCSELQSLEAINPLPAPQAPTQSLPAQDPSETTSSHIVVYIVAGVIVVSSSSFIT
jgi:hypothetical protein